MSLYKLELWTESSKSLALPVGMNERLWFDDVPLSVIIPYVMEGYWFGLTVRVSVRLHVRVSHLRIWTLWTPCFYRCKSFHIINLITISSQNGLYVYSF